MKFSHKKRVPTGGAASCLPVLVLIALVYAGMMALGVTCPIKFVTGLSCPGCGMTRAWLALLRLDGRAALAYHPLFWLVPPAGALLIFQRKLPKKLVNGCVCAVCVLFVAVYLVRLLSGAAPEVVSWEWRAGLVSRVWNRLLGVG